MTHAVDALIDPPGEADAGLQELRTAVVTDLPAFQRMRPELEALCEDLCEENVFYEPWMVEAAMVHLAARQSLSFLCFYATGRPDHLCGFFPLARVALHPLLPLPIYQLWNHPHCFRCTPLVRRGFAEACWTALFDWVERRPSLHRVLDLRRMPAGGEVERALRRTLEKRPSTPFAVLEQETAFLSIAVGSDSETVLRKAMSGTTLGKLRRQQRRLAEHGQLVFAELEEETDQDGLVGQFLQLESSGWKGREGTALACRKHEEDFFRAVVAESRARGRLSLLTMRLDGRLLAAQSSLLGRSGSFLFKTAYDETYSKYSPGVLLEIEHLRRMHDPDDPLRGRLRWSDSCAAPGFGPVYRCWPERRSIRNYRIACGPAVPRLILALWSLLHRIHHRLPWGQGDRGGGCKGRGTR